MARKTPPQIKKIRTIFGVSEYVLSNGLKVLFKQVKAAPVVAVCVTYHVGSRNEVTGRTGATHILEHILFKDSKKFNRKNGKPMMEYLESLGAVMNASTSLDRTNYYEMLPRENLESALAVEADRMRGSLFTDQDLESEMTVVRNEYEQSRNNPFELLGEVLLETGFLVHPYRIPTIGLKEDIEGATAKTLREFYDTFYWPNNATLSIFGDVSRKDVESLVLKHFGSIPTSPYPIPTMDVVEPIQLEARACEIKKAAGVNILSLGYKIPCGTHADFPAVYTLGMVLGGGLSSRLQKKLVDTGLVSDLSVAVYPLFDQSMMIITATVGKDAVPATIFRLLRKELKNVVQKGITGLELSRARERILSQIAQEHDGVLNEILATSEATATGDWTLGYRFENQIKKMKPSNINKVAKKYLVPEGETSGLLIDTAETV